MSRVLPGVADVFASPRRLHSILMSDDLPTLLLPMKAYSGLVSLGHWLTLADDRVNSDDFIITVYSFLYIFLCKVSGNKPKEKEEERKT